MHSTRCGSSVVDQVERDGFAIVENILPAAQCRQLIQAIEESAISTSGSRRSRAGRRDLLTLPVIRELAHSQPLHSLVDPILGMRSQPVRGLFFDKTADANWIVPWHQDLSIAVEHRIDVPGFGPWSVKGGIPHVQPPPSVLEKMLTVRVHLDDCDEANGPLCVIPGTHRHPLAALDVTRLASQERTLCTVAAGGVVLMRPMILHTSAPAKRPTHRRVIHIEYAAIELPGGLQWHARRRPTVVV